MSRHKLWSHLSHLFGVTESPLLWLPQGSKRRVVIIVNGNRIPAGVQLKLGQSAVYVITVLWRVRRMKFHDKYPAYVLRLFTEYWVFLLIECLVVLTNEVNQWNLKDRYRYFCEKWLCIKIWFVLPALSGNVSSSRLLKLSKLTVTEQNEST